MPCIRASTSATSCKSASILFAIFLFILLLLSILSQREGPPDAHRRAFCHFSLFVTQRGKCLKVWNSFTCFLHKKLLIYKQKYCRLPYCYHEWGLSTLKRKNRPLCETPRSGYFCGPDKYLRLQEHTISEELFPVMEVDSYFVLVRSGSGSFIINGEEFPVQAEMCIRDRPGSSARRC